MTKLNLIGYASGVAGVDPETGRGPSVIQRGGDYQWAAMIHPRSYTSIPDVVSQACGELAAVVSELCREQKPFCVIGGDHTSAIGTFSGVFDAVHEKGELGLIWIDAHMDSHTPETSESGRLHGMPLACLLGYGNPGLTHILHHAPKVKPENLCLVGVRSFEKGEAELLRRLNVRIYFMKEVKERGFVSVMKEAVRHVSAHTIGYGVSLDLDVMDPEESPGVGVPEKNGVNTEDLLKIWPELMRDPKLLGSEIVEFDPSRDNQQRTEKLIISLLNSMISHDYT